MDQSFQDDECSSDDESDSKTDYKTSNRIFLNFTREFTHPERDKNLISKTQDLFATISSTPEMQEMKVSGWLGNPPPPKPKSFPSIFNYFVFVSECDKEGSEEAEEEESKFSEDTATAVGGHRFAMSRDFWYRKLNTLKARKLDEAAVSENENRLK